jgi:hypothetical protein
MNAILLFCAYMTFIYLPWDIFIKPLEVDQEVWLVAHAQLAAAVDESISVADCVRHGLLGINRSARQ